MTLLFWRKPKLNPAATADIEALTKAMKMLDAAQMALYRERGDCEEWMFLIHSERHLRKQREAAFRWTLGREE